MLRIPGKTCSLLTTIALVTLLSATAVAQLSSEPIRIEQSRGADQSVKYEELTKIGPWDDRNYELTKQDLTYLSADEHQLDNQLPVFFRVEMRKEMPNLRTSGPAQYPRAALQIFYLRHGGLMRDGKIENDRRVTEEKSKKTNQPGKEVQLNQNLGANEITVEINPANPQQVIAGSNNSGGQEMYFSTDGGITWTIQGVLPSTCCDPTVDWSSDGSVAYTAALTNQPTLGVRAWRSFDGGQTWVDGVDIVPSGCDKEFIHSDRSPASPHQDNVYVTYHCSNTMQFARSTNQGLSYSAPLAFGGAPGGIGSDITTTSNGDIYYAYGAFGTQTVELLKSTDGGVTFNPSVSIASTNGSFDFPIPAMETRNAWIYATIDADRSGGLFDGSVYVSWTDVTGPESGIPANNHTQVRVAYSRDGGASWDQTIVHPTADVLAVDRFNQWMKVDEFGNVHVVFYDTRNSVDRTGVDLYYTFSSDGGVSFSDPQRISSETSANLTDGQEWGDYNGISVLGDTIISSWTDNRDGPPNMKDVYVDDEPNAGAAPGFSLAAAPLVHGVCALDTLDDITVSVGSVQGFVNPVTLNLNNLPGEFTGFFSTNPVTPPGMSIASVTVGAVAAGDYSFDIAGTATGAANKSIAINVAVSDLVPVGTTLLSPADGALDVSTAPVLSWSAVAGATSYIVEIDDDPAFGSIDFTMQTTDTSASPSGSLSTQTTYYWRVRAENPCGEGANSAAFSFTTGPEICSASFGAIPDGGPAASDDLIVIDAGELTDLDVSILATHTWVGDLVFTLTHLNTGTSVVLIDRPGVPASQFGCSGDNIDATLDDSSAIPVETQCSNLPALGGVLQPQQPLAAFNGEDLSGTWRLTAQDFATPDPGTVNEWCLIPTVDAPPPDSDGDGVANGLDNCPADPNPGQENFDGDAEGDVCDDDDDNDGVADVDDAFPFDPNESSDEDSDGVGDNTDVCPNTPAGEAVGADGCSASQQDDDGDGVANGLDNCPADPNPGQENFDGDAEGDVCDDDDDNDGVADVDDAFPFDPNESSDEDSDGVGDNTDVCPNTPAGEAVGADGCSASQQDDDGDGVANGLDNCPADPNPGQENFDGDAEGDVCDDDDDNDGVADVDDAFPFDPNESSDEDSDGVGDNTDVCPNTPAGEAVGADGCSASQQDDDGDGVANGLDNCPADPNPGQENFDGDAEGDVCDDDDDNDGVADVDDAFPFDPNESSDEDSDGVGDNTDVCPNTPAGEAVGADGCSASQQDDDGDGVANGLDNCPADPNPGQENFDGDAEGDVCDDDDDNDGVADVDDAFPFDPNESSDEDSDGVGDNTDVCPNTPAGEAVGADGCSASQQDDDGDGVANGLDNCPADPNPGQENFDGDAEGDVCDDDDDNDGVADVDDAFPFDPNESSDEDSDGVGDNTDVCPNTPAGEAVGADGCSASQQDDDGDGVANGLDNCPADPNPGQENFDGDAEGDVCDDDDDNDGVADVDDAFPFDPNESSDEDSDGVGDNTDVCPNTPAGEAVGADGCSASQQDDDGDGVANGLDNCPADPNPGQENFDGDAEGDVCDDDDDNDGVADVDDAFPFDPNESSDEDSDGVGDNTDVCPNTPAGEAVGADGCSASQQDDDGDGVANGLDNCPADPNPGQENFDGDAEGDVCDDDDDNDGVADVDDAFPFDPNESSDEDSDGVGDNTDVCPNTPAGEAVGADGCSASQQDDDGDGVANGLDNCPADPNPGQENFDGDAEGDVCDDDDDNDGVADVDDAFPFDPNESSDEDSDGVGDNTDVCPNTPAGEAVGADGCSASQQDDDGDGVANGLDNCPADPNPGQENFDGDAEGDVCDDDDDNDGVADVDDAFPFDPNESSDEDSDGVGDNTDVCPNTPAGEAVGADGCSASQQDDDGDGVANGLDNCPADPNPGQENFDGDAEGDVCDDDDDNDGVADVDDAFPFDPNESSDEDSDGVGDNTDVCPNTPAGEAVGADGCSASQQDDDGDGVANGLDNCPADPNPGQENFDGDAEGDVCDDDDDNDGVADVDDAFPFDPNESSDEDSDGVGDNTDVCPNTPAGEAVGADGCSASQQDDDGDGVANGLDNCPADPNPGQENFDGDAEGDVCDDDDDNDGVADVDDAFPFDPNESSDEDSDGVGDNTDVCPNTPAGEAVGADGCSASQQDDDGDGVANGLDNCPADPNPGQENFDGDAEGDVCDDDDDNDGVADVDDAFPFDPNESSDEDSDGVGDNTDVCPNTPAGEAVGADGCSASQQDDDGDGVANGLDNCPADPNPGQEDADGDGIGDACDDSGPDTDSDGIEDSLDNCILIPNADQRDTNGDGYGNICDADLNNDGIVNPVDLGLLRAVFFSTDPDADFNGDGVVNPVDLGIMRSLFFQPPGPSGLAP